MIGKSIQNSTHTELHKIFLSLAKMLLLPNFDKIDKEAILKLISHFFVKNIKELPYEITESHMSILYNFHISLIISYKNTNDIFFATIFKKYFANDQLRSLNAGQFDSFLYKLMRDFRDDV